MDDISASSKIPKIAIASAGVLMAVTMVLAIVAHRTGIGTSKLAPSATTQSRALLFLDRADGAIIIQQADNGPVVDILQPGNGGFIRGVMRGLARDRRARQIGPEAPFQLVRRADGALTLLDPATGGHTDLDAFGPTNAYAFARLLKTDVAKLQELTP